MNHPKFVQLAVAPGTKQNEQDRLYALDVDGEVWTLGENDEDEPVWVVVESEEE